MSTFRQVLGLWLVPDFAGVERGEIPPPHVNYDTLDTRDVAQTLSKFNDCGEDVAISVPNDAVDQVTVQFRLTGRVAGSPQCEDFALELLNMAERTGYLDTRGCWAELHALPNRRHAPPPVLLLFVVSGDFDGVMVWSQQLRMRLGIRAADMLKQIAGDVADADYQGHLPSELAMYFGRTFGIPYRRECLVTGLASSPVPY